ncbi:PEP/pyruvate-binding domain-containing protein, partial [Candidatus Hodarchaeum mangrovi]
SSALAEDSVQASFGGQFETELDVNFSSLYQAILKVHESRMSDRVKAYSEAKGITFEHEVAVVVQELIHSDFSGVLFTGDPVSGDRDHMVGNYIHGLGDQLVSGEKDAIEFQFKKPKGKYDGPAEFQQFASQLYKLGMKIERELGLPQDIEFAISKGKVYILQSRPITTFVAIDPVTFKTNATFSGDLAWSNQIMAEVFPKPLTPASWSVWEILYNALISYDKMKQIFEYELPVIGCIAGRPYLNFSFMYSFLLKLLRSDKRAREMIERTMGTPPKDLTIPLLKISLLTVLTKIIPDELAKDRRKRKLMKNFDHLASENSIYCRETRKKIIEIEKKQDLLKVWIETKAVFLDFQTMQDYVNEQFAYKNRSLTSLLDKNLNKEDSEKFYATISIGSDELASAGQLVGLHRIVVGEMSQEEYLDEYGHRDTFENYLSVPRPYENSSWLESQIQEFKESGIDFRSLLRDREQMFLETFQEISGKIGQKKARKIKKTIDEFNEFCEKRELVRTELSRVLGLIRAFLLRAGELTKLNDDIFYLTIDEICKLLSIEDDDIPELAYIPLRRETHKQNEKLPTLPTWIRGRFDPFQWAENPHRNIVIYDPDLKEYVIEDENTIEGKAGSAGQYEGIVRRIDDPSEGHKLLKGEILVTNTTNIGWTILFSKAGAIVTDIGAVLSHAAIVARELGIPAVVGTGTGSVRLKTGDRVLVDGSKGIVRIIQRA